MFFDQAVHQFGKRHVALLAILMHPLFKLDAESDIRGGSHKNMIKILNFIYSALHGLERLSRAIRCKIILSRCPQMNGREYQTPDKSPESPHLAHPGGYSEILSRHCEIEEGCRRLTFVIKIHGGRDRPESIEPSE